MRPPRSGVVLTSLGSEDPGAVARCHAWSCRRSQVDAEDAELAGSDQYLQLACPDTRAVRLTRRPMHNAVLDPHRLGQQVRIVLELSK